jgi:hypothetical protein
LTLLARTRTDNNITTIILNMWHRLDGMGLWDDGTMGIGHGHNVFLSINVTGIYVRREAYYMVKEMVV